MIGSGAAQSWISSGHRELLATVQEFARELDGCQGGACLLEVSRGATAFLRHSLLTFAAAEQAHLGDDLMGDSAALDHAFLAMEIDRLDALVRQISPATSDDLLPRLRRSVHRIEAVLELHTEREALPAPAAAAPSAEHGTRLLSAAEAFDFLRTHEWGTLAVSSRGAPYAVPVGYGVLGESIVLAMGSGEKLAAVLAEPRVCLTVSAVRSGDDWSCVVARGAARRVDDLLGRARALRAIGRGRVPLTAAALRRASGATVFRLDPTELSGRVRS